MKRLRVLIIDDDRIYALGLKTWLKGLGIAGRIRAADAVPYGEEYEAPDMVILDPQMVGVSYKSTIREVKRRFPCCRIVVCTHSKWFESGFSSNAMQAGADAFFCKGEPDDQLFMTIMSLLESRLLLDGTEKGQGSGRTAAIA